MSTPITPETGNAPPQGASAITSESVPLLSDDEVNYHIKIHNDGFIGGMHMVHLCRAIEQAVRAKLGAPMTEEQVMEIANSHVTYGWLDDYIEAVESIVRTVERSHGIVGKEGV